MYQACPIAKLRSLHSTYSFLKQILWENGGRQEVLRLQVGSECACWRAALFLLHVWTYLKIKSGTNTTNRRLRERCSYAHHLTQFALQGCGGSQLKEKRQVNEFIYIFAVIRQYFYLNVRAEGLQSTGRQRSNSRLIYDEGSSTCDLTLPAGGKERRDAEMAIGMNLACRRRKCF